MHTKVRPIFRVRAAIAAGLLLWVLVAGLSSTLAQPRFPGVQEEQSLNVRVDPAAFWTPRVGPGVGLGLVAHGLARPYDQWLLTAAPARHEQVGTVSFASANPRRAARYLLVDARALHTDADWLGPADRRTVLNRSSLRARLRVGQSLLNRRLLVQPHLTAVHHRVDAVDRPTGPPPTFASSLPVPGSQKTGLRAGVDLRFDTRDDPTVPTRGLLLQGTWDRYLPLGDTDLQFDQVDLDAYGYVPLGGLHRFVTRVSVTLTRSRGEASIPTYELPTVGGAVVPGWARGRFVGPDRFVASTLYRFPLVHYDRLATLDAHVGVHLTSVYDRLGDQFAATVSFDDSGSLDGATRPLRPSASVGLQFAMPRRDHVSLELGVGVSPEGVSAVRLSFVRALQALRPPHHTSDNLR